MKTLLAIGMALFMFAACASKQNNNVNIEDYKWITETMNGESVDQEEGRNMFIQFDKTAGKVNGKAACNRYFGTYELNGNNLKFSQMGSTRMACLNMDQETVFLKILQETTGFQIKDNKLVLMQDKKELAVLVREVEAGEQE
ncbi:META domain-containing protein [Porphyromonadaceae bacterium OttesenSCG-928-L07]|nr:META domain-containing protein [Porphyromonadaceae bacterium OttesenSCG-928-L07]MDL2251376.1 META domain-containing protein [Odoribacter sp. OttesenSCG-928-J03]